MRTPEDWAMNEWQGRIKTAVDAIVLVARIQADALGQPFNPNSVKVRVEGQTDAAPSIPELTKEPSRNVAGEENKRFPAYDGATDKLWFGKHKGVQLDDVPPDYLAWLFSTGVENEKLRNYIWNARNAINQDLRKGSEYEIKRYILPTD